MNKELLQALKEFEQSKGIHKLFFIKSIVGNTSLSIVQSKNLIESCDESADTFYSDLRTALNELCQLDSRMEQWMEQYVG